METVESKSRNELSRIKWGSTGNDFSEGTSWQLVALEFLEEGRKDIVVFCALEILTAVVKSLESNAVQREGTAIVGLEEILCTLSFGLCLEPLDVGGLAVAGITAKNDEFRLRIEDGGRELLVQLSLDIGLWIIAACSASTAFTLAIEPEELVDVRVMIIHVFVPRFELCYQISPFWLRTGF